MTFHIGAKPGDIAETVLLPGDPYRARWAAEHGVVHLVQIRRGAGDFSYVAIARPRSPKVQTMVASLMLPQAA